MKTFFQSPGQNLYDSCNQQKFKIGHEQTLFIRTSDFWLRLYILIFEIHPRLSLSDAFLISGKINLILSVNRPVNE